MWLARSSRRRARASDRSGSCTALSLLISLTNGSPILTEAEAHHVGCIVDKIETYFQRELDPEVENRWFAMDIEFKLVGSDRTLVVKQARPYSFGSSHQPADCREL